MQAFLNFLNSQNSAFIINYFLCFSAVENFFGMIRRRVLVPSGLELKYAIRTLTIIMHTRPSLKGSYEEVDYKTQWLAEMKDIKKLKQIRGQAAEKEDYEVINGEHSFNFAELSALVCGIGYLFKVTICSKSLCETCKEELIQDEPSLDVHAYITQRCYTPNAMIYPTLKAIEFFTHCEKIYRQNQYAIRRGGDPLDEVMTHLKEVGLRDHNMPVCHLQLLIDRFFKIGMYFEVRQKNVELKVEKSKKKADKIYASKSAAGHALK